MKRPHFALPEIYDDSLSYYDVLRKLIKSMHVIVDNLNKIPEQIANEAKARSLGDQGLQTNIDNEAMARQEADNELRELISTSGGSVTEAQLNEEVTARQQGDAVLDGKISELKGDLSNISQVISSPNIYDETECTNGYMDAGGKVHTSETFKYTTKIPVNTGDVIRSYRMVGGSLQPYPMFVVTGFLSTTGNASTSHSATNVSSFTVVDGTNYVVISVGKQIVEITINEEPSEYTPKFDQYAVIKDSALPKASETDFGVAKMWVTVDEGGNKVLNISTGAENE